MVLIKMIQATSKTLQVIAAILVVAISAAKAHLHHEQEHHCHSSCGTKTVPYPFGFSPECAIQLQCNTTTSSDMTIGEFQVLNITHRGILIRMPAECNRPISKLLSLFNSSYAISARNNLLLQDCNRSLDSCVMPMRSMEGLINGSNCDDVSRNGNLNCYAKGFMQGSSPPVYDSISYDDVNLTDCKSVFSSFALSGDMVSLQFQRLELEWWIDGGCSQTHCSKDSNCINVTLSDGGIGHRCHCNDGFVGDGFRAGHGCRRDSSCNAAKYMSGKCGGTAGVGVLIGGLLAGAVMAGLAFLCYFIRKRSNSMRNQMSARRLLCEAAGNSTVPFFTYKEIERATNGFSEQQRLGIGAYGTVYAGKLHDNDWVAIKKIRNRDTDSFDQVMNEIKLLSSVSHPNLVRLLGCCIEEGEPILVYEFMPNGTLCQHLQRERGNGLPWTIRLTIASETANAIAYLHSVVNPPIYHRDIKSSNILLDKKYKSKVADFGLSRLGMTESSHISTAPQGTPGYLDPQYHQYFHLSDKSDVYSFGVVLVEMITGMRVVDFSRPHSEVNLAALAVDRIGRGCVDEMIDSYLEPHRDAWTLSSIHNVAELAFRCLAFHRDMRPTMMEVAEELEQMRLSAWVPTMYPMALSCSSSENGSERWAGVAASRRKGGVASKRLLVQERMKDCLNSLEEVKDSSPVSVQDPWLSEQSSPSTNSLLGNVLLQ